MGSTGLDGVYEPFPREIRLYFPKGHLLAYAQDVALYGVLCALGSLDRAEVLKLLESQTFRESLDMAPQIRELALDFCSCRYAACLASLERLQEALCLDVHLHGQVANLCEQIRSKGIVQYFAPFLSVSLHRMADAFNTDVESMQRELAKLIGQRQLDAKIDSERKILQASPMVVVGKHFTFWLLVVSWLKSNHLTASIFLRLFSFFQLLFSLVGLTGIYHY